MVRADIFIRFFGSFYPRGSPDSELSEVVIRLSPPKAAKWVRTISRILCKLSIIIMNNQFEKPKEKSGLEFIRENIANAPIAVEEEFSRTANSWLECFGSRIFQMELYLGLKNTRADLSTEKYREAEIKLEQLKECHATLQEHFPNKDTIPPDDIKKELFNKLDILS